MHQGFYINKYELEKENFVKQFAKKRHINRAGRIYNAINKYSLKYFIKNIHVAIYHPTYYEDTGLNKGKKIITVYDMIHEKFPKYFHDNTIEKKRNMISSADGIIAISEATKKDLVELLNVDPSIIEVIYLANSLKYSISNNRHIAQPYLLYVGNRNGYKNFEKTLIAYANSKYVKEVKLVCFGGGKFNQDEFSKISHLGLEKQIIQLNGNDNLLANIYQHAEAFIYPSEYEGFGLPPLESMYYKTPVLCSNTSSIPEVVGKAGLYFNPKSIEEIRDAINKVLTDNSLKKTLINEGIKQEQKFSWDKCANETLNFYYTIYGR